MTVTDVEGDSLFLYLRQVSEERVITCECDRCGGGRSAVFLAVDYCLKQLEMEDVVDIYSAVLHLRRFRKNMIRTLVGSLLVA